MIQPIGQNFLQNGKYFSILNFLILQQNITTVWIFYDQLSLHKYGHEVNTVSQYLVGSVPKYISDLNANRTMCVDNENIKILSIFFVTESFGPKVVDCICASDYTIVMVENISSKLWLPLKASIRFLRRVVFGRIIGSDIVDLMNWSRPMNDLFVKDTHNRSEEKIRFFFEPRPPAAMIQLLDEKLMFYGPDAYLAREISKMLNMTAVIETNFGIEYANLSLKVWFDTNDTKYWRSVQSFRIRERMLQPMNISNFYRK